MGPLPLGGRRILITGGTGSFGSALAARALSEGAIEVRSLARNEHGHLQQRERLGHPEQLISIVGDVRDAARLSDAVKGVDIVFHAAALKHVHFCESHPSEAAATNITGALNVFRAARAAGVSRVVTISTDKAVSPVNAMGMTKAVQERLASELGSGDTPIVVIRYGNVIGSQGSVLLHWQQLLRQAQQPIRLPLTDVSMTRFFLRMEEAIELALVAAAVGRTGELFVRKLPAARMLDVALTLQCLACARIADFAAFEADYESWVEVQGIRPGEKIHEELVSPEEMRRVTERGHYLIVDPYRSPEGRYQAAGAAFSSDRAERLAPPQILDLLQQCGITEGVER